MSPMFVYLVNSESLRTPFINEKMEQSDIIIKLNIAAISQTK